MPPALPTAEERLTFLTRVERLLSEGTFVATYKYALLMALTELAIERGDDSGAPLDLPIRDIAAKFIALYWRQAAPYGSAVGDGTAGMLVQNTGEQASIIKVVTALRAPYGSLAAAQESPDWSKAVSRVAALLKTMPLWRLQKLRRGSLTFLYEPATQRGNIRLLHGVAANLRYFHGFILRTVQGEWLRFVQGVPANQRFLGPTVDLSEFLFGRDRAALVRARDGLRELQSGRCFYCETALREVADVDHFIPWSRYPRDLVHNLLAAHPSCNANKSNLLAAESLRAKWSLWIDQRDADLADIGAKARLIIDRPTAERVAEWSYGHARELGAQFWLGGRRYGSFDPNKQEISRRHEAAVDVARASDSQR